MYPRLNPTSLKLRARNVVSTGLSPIIRFTILFYRSAKECQQYDYMHYQWPVWSSEWLHCVQILCKRHGYEGNDSWLKLLLCTYYYLITVILVCYWLCTTPCPTPTNHGHIWYWQWRGNNYNYYYWLLHLLHSLAKCLYRQKMWCSLVLWRWNWHTICHLIQKVKMVCYTTYWVHNK